MAESFLNITGRSLVSAGCWQAELSLVHRSLSTAGKDTNACSCS